MRALHLVSLKPKIPLVLKSKSTGVYYILLRYF